MRINARTRLKLAEHAQFKCVWCNQTTRMEMGYMNSATIEHMVPVSRGGSHKLNNLAHACWRCNGARHNQCATKFQVMAATFEPDVRTIEQAREHARDSRIQHLKQLAGSNSFSYALVPDSKLTSKERYRKDRTLVKQALKLSRQNPFDAGTRCHRMFESECAKLPESSIWSTLWNKLTAWCVNMHSAIMHREIHRENCSR